MTDTKEMILCPACRKPMAKIYDPTLKVNVDVCVDGCGGIYFDNDEYEIFRDHQDNIEDMLELIMTDNPQKVDESSFRICPTCNSQMIKAFIDGAHKRIQVDKCIECGGIFLDYGELSMLRLD